MARGAATRYREAMPSPITVSQLVGLLRDVIENHEFFSDLWLTAEIRTSAGRHPGIATFR